MKTKKTNQVTRTPSPARFEFEHTTAQSVCLAGSFNDWNPEATEMIPDRPGHWVKELFLPPGTYEYLFVVDGEWVEDPRAAESVPNPFSRNNSVLRVAEVVVTV